MNQANGGGAKAPQPDMRDKCVLMIWRHGTTEGPVRFVASREDAEAFEGEYLDWVRIRSGTAVDEWAAHGHDRVLQLRSALQSDGRRTTITISASEVQMIAVDRASVAAAPKLVT